MKILSDAITIILQYSYTYLYVYTYTCAEAIHIWLVYIIYHVSIYCYTGVPGPQPSGLVWLGIIVNPVPPNYGTPELLYPHTKFPSESCIPVHNSLLDPVRGYNIRVVD